jgi:D-serine dehydratase
MEPFLNPYDPLLRALGAGEEICWDNPFAGLPLPLPYRYEEIADASLRLRRFAPLIRRLFPETEAAGGMIESPLTEIPRMREALNARGAQIAGRLFLKRDCDLAVAGSVKARGGVYEVLRVTETLALRHGLLAGFEDDYARLADDKARAVYSGYKMQVGSTGNLGMSIGIMSAALGYEAIVHMSADAKEWKKALLRSRGVTVLEYGGSYEAAVAAGRACSADDPKSHFVDDENSKDLFLGYATAAPRLMRQLDARGLMPNKARPLFAAIPCGVGGAPGGVTYGLKSLFGETVRCRFAEPTGAPCVTLGLMTGLGNKISVADVGLSGRTAADGLAVGRASGLVCKAVRTLVDGCDTVLDARLPEWQRLLWETEGLFIEPSAAAAFRSVTARPLPDENAVNIVWATGGSLVPEEIRQEMLSAPADGAPIL